MRTIHTRTEFLASPAGQVFAEAISLPDFAPGVRAALAEFAAAEPRGQTWEAKASAHDYQQGARDFAQYLLTFIDQEPATPQPTNTNLKWPTKQSLQALQQQRQAKK